MGSMKYIVDKTYGLTRQRTAMKNDHPASPALNIMDRREEGLAPSMWRPQAVPGTHRENKGIQSASTPGSRFDETRGESNLYATNPGGTPITDQDVVVICFCIIACCVFMVCGAILGVNSSRPHAAHPTTEARR